MASARNMVECFIAMRRHPRPIIAAVRGALPIKSERGVANSTDPQAKLIFCWRMVSHRTVPLSYSRIAADQEWIRRAFELAYFIHASKGIALCVAEEAWCKLEHTIGSRDKRQNSSSASRLQSEMSSTTGMRTRVRLNDEQLLQLLVYAESDSWERATENGDTPYHLADEDLVIRFIKHLVRISLKRSTFYAVLAIGRLSYDYGTSEVRQIYDVLMQDGARFRDNPYLRKQKRVLMREVIERFGKLVRVVETPDREHRFLAQPTTQMLIDLVRECLRSFTPWNTTCILPASFDPTDNIPALSFSGTDSDDESLIELNRFHTALHPDCFSRIIASLGFDSPDKRLAMPQFFFSNGDAPRGDRSKPPLLAEADYRQFGRTREERSARRRAFFARGLQVYVDGVERAAFDPRLESRVSVRIKPTANVVEVHGKDGGGDLPLMTLLVHYYDIPSGEAIKDALLLEGGQKITTSITPVINNIGDIEEVHVEINYAETQPLRVLALLFLRAWSRLGKSVRPGAGLRELKPRYSWLALTSVAAALILVVSAIIWRQLDQPAIDIPAGPQVELPPVPPAEPQKTPPPRNPNENQARGTLAMARARWDSEPDAFSRAIRIEGRRGDIPAVKITPAYTKLLTAVPSANPEGEVYRRYRITLVAAEDPVWRRILRKPRGDLSDRARILEVAISPPKFPKADSYQLRFEGESQSGWQTLGRVALQPAGK